MISIRSSADLAGALNGGLSPPIRRLLEQRRDQLKEAGSDFGDVAHAIIVQHGDELDQIEAEVGVPLTTNLVDGARLGERGFTHNFEFVQRHVGGWIEAVLILSDDGFAVALFVPDLITTDPRLLQLLRS